MKKTKIAYLPLYIKLYDDINTATRKPLVEYMNTLVSMIESQGFEVVLPEDVCRIKEEFDRAAEKFNSDPEIVAVVTEHLAYSPSRESIEALLSLKAPIIVLDTTPSYELISCAAYSDRISPNHGIHGVQDMCNLLKRNGKPFQICVGHAMHSDVIARVCGLCRAAACAKAFRESRIGMVGGEFEGMGDFRISDERYESEIGAKTVRMSFEDGKKYTAAVTDDEIQNEIISDAAKSSIFAENEDNYRAATRAGLAVRKWMNDNGLNSVTVNFLHIEESGLEKMPFMECCKALERGQGYAGEGDNLTAGLTGALLASYPNTTFTEMFCPDWEKDIILLSHMGEFNPRLVAWKPHVNDKPFKYNVTGDTVAMSACYRKGTAVLANLAPMNDSFSLILSKVELTDDGLEYGAYRKAVQGWLKPAMPIADFLKAYSEAGGTHHSAMVYDADIQDLAAFGKMMGFNVVII